jgi:osmotically-inducible protein OsmY
VKEIKHSRVVLSIVAAGVIAAVTQLSACAVAVVGGVAGVGTLVATAGRRPGEVARDDRRIESQASDAIEKEFNGRDHHVNVAVYYRKALLTGEVTSDADRARAQTLTQGVEGVQGVFNDLAVMPPSGVTSRSQDAYITSKVRARLLNTNGVPAASVKVLTERGTVYLMGQLTRQEVQTTTEAIQKVGGVQRVARVVDYVPDSAVSDGSSSTITSGSSNGSEDKGGGDADVATNTDDAASANGHEPPATGAETRPVRESATQSVEQPIQVRTLPPAK